MADSIVVRTLLGKKNLDFSIHCLKSLLQKCDSSIKLEIFDDGTLNVEEVSLLKKELIGSEVVLKSKRDEQVNHLLNVFPSCQHFRETNILALKLFDIMLFQSEAITSFYVDSDILFIQRFSFPAFGTLPVFMTDYQNAYSFNPLNFLFIPKKIFPKINTGFFYFPLALYDLNSIEDLLKTKKLFNNSPFWAEQTVWAFLSSLQKNVGYFDAEQITMATKKLKTSAKCIAIHLVSSHRNHFNTLQTRPKKVNTGCTTELRYEIKNRNLSKIGYLFERIIGKLG